MTTTQINADIVIIGGGIAGLWLLNRLCNDGYNAILFEQDKLGGAQTIASQGMIHGGIKYALGGVLTGASEAIADMPNHWRRCLLGEGDVDLRGAKVLSDHFYLWSTQSITSRVSSFFASRVTRGRVDSVPPSARPPVFNTNHFKGKLYKLADLVLDVPSVISVLAHNCRGRIFSIDWKKAKFEQSSSGSINSLTLQVGSETTLAIHAQQFIFSAGEGNERLQSMVSSEKPTMQRRPLRQVLVKHDYDYSLYAHCMGSNPSPRLTISSHKTRDGKTVWYLGGDLATQGINSSDGEIVDQAKKELQELFPWLDFGDSEWATLYINRAEPKQKGLIKPDKAFVATSQTCDNVIVGWPTKLTLSPNMSDEVISVLKEKNIVPQYTQENLTLQQLPIPEMGIPCWESCFNNINETGKD
ncbi:MAG: glycerol-3-phosphate dehydrogenase [Oceanicoccus sp.]|jgi:glycerol-3-phosphate dehydrogenase